MTVTVGRPPFFQCYQIKNCEVGCETIYALLFEKAMDKELTLDGKQFKNVLQASIGNTVLEIRYCWWIFGMV